MIIIEKVISLHRHTTYVADKVTKKRNKIANKLISFSRENFRIMSFTVRLKGEKKGTFCYQVAMNYAFDLAEAMSEIEDFDNDMITINGRPYSYYFE